MSKREKEREKSTVRTDDSPVQELAQCKLMKENPWFNWSRWTSLDLLISFLTERLASSSKTTGGGATVVVVEVLFHSSISCSLRIFQ